MTSTRTNLLRQWIAPTVLFVFGLMLYGLTLSRFAFPGSSTILIAGHLDINPFMPLTDALWGWIVRLLARLPIGGDPVLRLNIFSALCGAGVAVLLYNVMTRLPTSFAPAPVITRVHVVSPVRVVGAFFASLYLLVSLPFWIVSTRAMPESWNVLTLLASVYCLLRFRTSRRLLWAWMGCLIFGLGLTGYATMIPVAPFYALLLIVYLVQNGLLRARNVLLLALAFVAGLLPYLLQAFRFMESPAYVWRTFKGLGDVLFYMLRDEYHSLRSGLPQTGWLIVLLVSLLPWLVVIVFRLGHERKIAPTSRKGGYVLNSVLTVIGVLVALNIAIDPWRHSGPQNPLVTPYLLISMWFGGLASFWFLELIHHEGGKQRRPAWQKPLGYGILALMGLTLIVAGVKNLPIADGRSSKLTQQFVDETLDSLRGCEWLISAGALDDNLAISAHERGQKLHILNLAAGNSSAYLQYVASFFDDPRLRGIAQVGLVPLLNEWFKIQPAASEKVAIQSMADLWYAADRQPMPQRVVSIAKKDKPADPSELLKQHQATWQALQENRKPVVTGNAARSYDQWIFSHTARVANDLGVYLEENGRGDLAATAYLEARQLDTNNLSAAMNLYTLYKHDKNPEADKVEKEIKEALSNPSVRRMQWALAYYYGFIRSPEAYASRGWAWALSGKPNLGMKEMNQAMEMSGGHSSVQLAMSGILLSENKTAEAERTYLDIIQKNPTNQAALFGLVHVAILKSQFDVARGYLHRLRELGAPNVAVQMQEALIASMSGDSAGSIKIFRNITKDHPENWVAWTALALEASEANDSKTLELALEKIKQARNLAPSIHISLAQLTLKQNDRAGARQHFEEALRMDPVNVPALENLARLDVQERRREEAEKHVRRLLTLNPRNQIANYILGSLQVFNGQYALAEASYRVAMNAQTTATPDVLNDLAWVLAQQGKYKEALTYALTATKEQEHNGSVWDTLGYIQLKLGDLTNAEKSLQKAIALLPQYPGVMLRMAEVYEAKGMVKEALQLANQMMARASELDHDTLDELNALMKRLRQNGAG